MKSALQDESLRRRACEWQLACIDRQTQDVRRRGKRCRMTRIRKRLAILPIELEPPKRRWSREVARRSDALDLRPGVFRSDDPRRIARLLKRSAEKSRRRKTRPFQSAMSMLNLNINRAGRTLPANKRRVLERAKHEPRVAFGRDE